MTTTLRAYPTRVNLTFKNKKGQVALDQMRAIDRQRLVRRMGVISTNTAQSVSNLLVEMFTR
jgi:mRNA interferase MazF